MFCNGVKIMKRRNGFVSNSSSASFVVLGYKLSESELDNAFKLKEFDVDESMFVRINRYHMYIGKIISSVDRDGISENEDQDIDWEIVKEVTDEGAKFGLGKPKIFDFSIDC